MHTIRYRHSTIIKSEFPHQSLQTHHCFQPSLLSPIVSPFDSVCWNQASWIWFLFSVVSLPPHSSCSSSLALLNYIYRSLVPFLQGWIHPVSYSYSPIPLFLHSPFPISILTSIITTISSHSHSYSAIEVFHLNSSVCSNLLLGVDSCSMVEY